MFATETELVNHYQPQLATMWEHLLSQTNNRLKDCVTVKSLSGKVTFIDQIQSVEFEEKIGRMSKTELDEMTFAKRAIYAREFAKSIGFDEFDEIKLGKQRLPIAETMQKLQEAYERTSEKIILDSVQGIAYEGESGVTPVEFPSSQIIPVDFARDTTNTQNRGLTFDKFARLRRLAMESEAIGQGIKDGSDMLVLATNAAGIEDLYHDIFVHHKEYLTAVERVRQGEVDMFLGVHIKRTEQINERTVGTDTVSDNLAWVKSRICFGARNNYSTKMSIRDDLSEAIQIRAKFACGGTRLEEKGAWMVPSKKTA